MQPQELYGSGIGRVIRGSLSVVITRIVGWGGGMLLWLFYSGVVLERKYSMADRP
jgi:hypothetical protein